MIKTYRIAIFVKEIAYGDRLMNYINKTRESHLLAMSFSYKEKLYQYLSNNKVDIILTDCEVEYKEGKVIYLVEENTDKSLTKYSNEVIYKYSKAHDIIAEITRNLMVDTYKKSSKDVEIVGVYSPFGRSGKTILARNLCSCLEYERTLYLGLDEFAINTKEIQGMDSIMYYAKKRDETIGDKIKEICIQEELVDVLSSPLVYTDLLQFNYSDFQWLISKLRDRNEYKRIVFDIGSGSLSDFHILELFDRLYITTLNSSEQKRKQVKTRMNYMEVECVDKLENFYIILEAIGLEEVKDRVLEVHIPQEANQEDIKAYAKQLV